MIKKKFMEWALDALVSYIQENGAEMAEKIAEWLKTLIDNQDKQTYASPPPVAGCEGWCNDRCQEFAAIQDAE